jgi:pimeloyl-ACP methyl ester carboxylesterase
MWQHATCKINEINVHYLRTGGDKPPLILLHGLMTNGACWTPLTRTLEEEYDVIMPDARGHGKSSVPSEGYHYDNLAADVMSLIEVLGLANPVLIGHSMGGMTAAVVANRNPKAIRGLILADPCFLTLHRQLEVHKSDVAAQHQRNLNRSKKDFLAELKFRQSHRSPELIELLAQARFQTSMHAFQVLKPPNPDYIQLIKTLAIPSLLIIGDVGAIVSPKMASELAELNQHLEIVQIAEAGHGIPYDQPEHFSAHVKAFLRSLII